MMVNAQADARDYLLPSLDEISLARRSKPEISTGHHQMKAADRS
jgi:hypothetical protein